MLSKCSPLGRLRGTQQSLIPASSGAAANVKLPAKQSESILRSLYRVSVLHKSNFHPARLPGWQFSTNF